MWRVEEHRRIGKQIASMPLEIQKRYEKWLDIATISGPPGLKSVRGFQRRSLVGKVDGYRSSRLNVQYRVIYRVVPLTNCFRWLKLRPTIIGSADMSQFRPAKRRL